MMEDSALVVLSGGQDSTTCLYWARTKFQRVRAISFDYGQRHRRELSSARVIAHNAGVGHEELTIDPSLLRSASPLVDRSAELERYSDYTSMAKIIGDRVELTFVPMRNALFLTVAANHAVAHGCFDLVTGVCGEDNANYPDCRAAFINCQQAAINLALGIDKFQIHTPLMRLTKAQTCTLAESLPGCLDALSLSHTCYAGAFPPCGTCHACLLRAEGFREAGIADPLVERAVLYAVADTLPSRAP